MSFRKKKIDFLNDDILKKEHLYEEEKRSSEEVREDIIKRTSELLDMIRKGKSIEGLSKALVNPPYGKDIDDVKTKHMNTVFELLSSIKTNEILNAIKILNTEQQDVLMKYLYKGLMSPKIYNPTILLNWHEKLVEVAGNGCIVRAALTDMRTV